MYVEGYLSSLCPQESLVVCAIHELNGQTRLEQIIWTKH